MPGKQSDFKGIAKRALAKLHQMDPEEQKAFLAKLIKDSTWTPEGPDGDVQILGGLGYPLEEHDGTWQRTFKIRQDYGVQVRILVGWDGDALWEVHHTFRLKECRKTHLLCEWTLYAHYRRGKLKDRISIHMYVVVPERLGKEFLYGVDISPGAKTFMCLTYKRMRLQEPVKNEYGQILEEAYVLIKMEVNGHDPVTIEPALGPISESVGRPLPFPIPERLLAKGSNLMVPIRVGVDTIHEVAIPLSC